jgi:hypothetical protein
MWSVSGLGGPAQPIAGARQCGRMLRAVGDAREMLQRGGRVVKEAQRDPAGREVAFRAIELLRRRRCVARDQVGRLRLADVEQLARQQPPLHPPLVEVIETRRVMRDGQHQLPGLGDLVVAPQPLQAGKEIARIVPRLHWHRLEQRLGVARFLGDRDACFGDREFGAPEPFGRAHGGIAVLRI